MIRPQSCPICKKELAPEAVAGSGTFPFCSPRCRQIDFFRWCDGRYAIVENLDPEVIEELQQQFPPEPSSSDDEPA